MDASDFFWARKSHWKWRSLTTLVLTSRQLEPSTKPDDILNLLDRAAGAAKRMPRLEIMELWNGRAGMVAIFRYQTPRYKGDGEKRQHHAVMTWKGTWQFALVVPVVRAWERVTFNLHGDSLAVRRERVDSRLIRSHGDAVCQLKLEELVVRPVSLRQIRVESLLGEDRIVIDHN